VENHVTTTTNPIQTTGSIAWNWIPVPCKWAVFFSFSSFDYRGGVQTSLRASRLFLTAHWASCKSNKQVRHRGNDRHVHKGSNSERERNKSHDWPRATPSIASGQFNTIHERTLSRLFHRKRQQLIKSICYYSNNNHKVISLRLANKVEIVLLCINGSKKIK